MGTLGIKRKLFNEALLPALQHGSKGKQYSFEWLPFFKLYEFIQSLRYLFHDITKLREHSQNVIHFLQVL
ncbi:hypothetical protein VP10329_21740 [Vibrio parahaemolyticus 10329]|nr:hypothetical protein VP10329_21740 [Vibrio parahaemolyticus 10329]